MVLSLGRNNFYGIIRNVLLLLSGSAMVTFDSHTSYDDAVNAKGAKLRGRDWMKTVSYMNEIMTSSNNLEFLMHLSAKLLAIGYATP